MDGSQSAYKRVVCGNIQGENCTFKLLIGTVVGAVGNSLSLYAFQGLLYLHVCPLCVQTLDGRENLLLVPDQSHAHLA